MKDRPSLWFALVALLAAVGVTTGRIETTPPATSSKSGSGQAPQPPLEVPPRITEPQCVSTPAPLKPLCRAVYEARESSQVAPGWEHLPWVERVRRHVRFAIVLVADPGVTGDTLRFDRTVETVQNVAERLRYRFTGYWIPWREPDTKSDAERAAKDPSVEPGTLVFRGRQETLVVFLVGESAVSGIQQLPFLNAISYIKVFYPAGVNKVVIAGPNFSGSLSPLKEAIRQASEVAGGIPVFRVISPSATVQASGNDFRRDAPGQPAITYDSVVHNDAYALDCMRGYLDRRWPWRPPRRAALRESATAFGATRFGGTRSGELLAVQFPRGIFRLRNASPDASARTLFTPETGSAVNQDRLALSLRGPGPGSDRVPSFAAGQVAVAQEAVLLAISSALRQHDVHMVRIVSSDVYDSIFLAVFLRRTCPGVRPVFVNADLLTVRAAEQLPLEGSLAMTTFPLIPQNQIWSAFGGGNALQPMSSRFEVGLHNAFGALMLEDLAENPPPEHRAGDRTATQDSAQELLDSSFPAPQYRDRSPLWLVAVGTNGYWPIALLDSSRTGVDKLLLRSKPGPKPPAGAGWPAPGEPAPSWVVVFTVVVLGAFTVGSLVILAQTDRVRDGATEQLLSDWATRPAEPGAAGRAFFATGACLVLAVMLFAMAGPVWMVGLRSQLSYWAVLYAWVSITAMVVLLAAAAAPWLKIRWNAPGMKKPVESKNVTQYSASTAMGVLGFLAFVALWSVSMATGEGMEGFFFCYRSLDLLNGVCPSMPFLFLGAGLLVLIALHQRRLALVGELPDSLPEPGDDALGGLNDAFLKAKEPLDCVVVSVQPTNILIAAAGVLTLCFLPLTERQQSLESMWYDGLHWATLVVFYLLVVFTWARFLAAWLHLKRGLDMLAAHPLGARFATLPAGHGLCTILRGGGQHGATGLPEPSLNTPAASGEIERPGAQSISLQYASFAGNVMLQLRSLLLFVATGFFLGIVSTLVYPFRSQNAMVWGATLNFVALGLPVLFAIVQIEKHPLLSAAPGDQRWQWGGAIGRVGLYLALPLIGLAGSHFPALGRYLVAVLQPAMHAVR